MAVDVPILLRGEKNSLPSKKDGLKKKKVVRDLRAGRFENGSIRRLMRHTAISAVKPDQTKKKFKWSTPKGDLICDTYKSAVLTPF